MAKKVLKVILELLLIIMEIVLLVFSYFMIVDIETKEPKEVGENCNISNQTYKGRKIFIIEPNEEKNDIVILYFHGGSYMAEASNKHWNFLEKLAIDTKSTIVMPDYPLTPKYNYKDVFEMVEPLYKEITKKIDVKNLIVMGDSAGGGLGLALLEKVSQESIPLPEKTILISPWLDVRLTNPKIEEVQKKDTVLNKETLKLAGLAYSGEDGINSYLVNPIDGDLEKIKNVTIFTGTDDILNPDVYVLQERAKEVNVEIEVKEYESAKHIWVIEKNSDQKLIEQAYKELCEKIEDSSHGKEVR